MKKRYRNTAFLVELLVNILVFSISCAILVGLFGKAGQIARDTHAENFAGAEAQSLIEIVKARGVQGLEDADAQPDGSLLFYYDEDWQPASGADAAYTIRLVVRDEATVAGVLSHLSAVAESRDGAEVFSIATASYQPASAGGDAL
ncbi:MAG: type II secretion system protein [Ruminococcaceae bacterium]|nr:type II secretion system protein [Oscillospiraceae bacterium]